MTSAARCIRSTSTRRRRRGGGGGGGGSGGTSSKLESYSYCEAKGVSERLKARFFHMFTDLGEQRTCLMLLTWAIPPPTHVHIQSAG